MVAYPPHLENNGNKLTTSLWTGELIRTAPSEITKAHLDFINAGSQVIITSSYQLSYLGCGNRGWSEVETDEALRASTQLAKDAVNRSGKRCEGGSLSWSIWRSLSRWL